MSLEVHAQGGLCVQIHVNTITQIPKFRGTLENTEGLHVRAKHRFRLNVSSKTFCSDGFLIKKTAVEN